MNNPRRSKSHRRRVTGIELPPLLQGLVAYYALDETSGTRYDSHTGGHHLDTITGNVGYNTGIQSNAQEIVDRDVASASINPTPNALEFGAIDQGNDDSFTVCFWFMPYQFVSYLGCLLHYSQKVVGGPAWQYEGYGFKMASNEVMAFWVGVGVLDGENTTQWAHTSAIIELDTWNFIAGYCDGDLQQFDVSCNLVWGGSHPCTNGLYAPSTPIAWYLGNIDAGDGGDHRLDELAVWNRRLSSAELSYLYNSGAGRTYAELEDYEG